MFLLKIQLANNMNGRYCQLLSVYDVVRRGFLRYMSCILDTIIYIYNV